MPIFILNLHTFIHTFHTHQQYKIQTPSPLLFRYPFSFLLQVPSFVLFNILAMVTFTTAPETRAKLLMTLAAVLIAFMVMSQMSGFAQAQSQAQTCSSQLTNLNVCAPFVVPGNTATPNVDCCGALQAVDSQCLCNTLRIASRMPSQCNLPPVNCAP